jgi:hypothetical protein
MLQPRLSPLVLALLLFGCGAAADPGADADVRDAAVPEAPAVPRCRPPAGVSGSPRTIDQVVALVNALPAPVTLPCLIESLDRPLQAFATHSVISLQPAAGIRSPRIFLIVGELVMSLVPDGMGSHTLEFGQFVDATRTIKGEIGFPVEGTLDRAAPYDRILNINGTRGTSCRFCHPDEEQATSIDYARAFISGAFRPNWRTRVEIPTVREERARCDAAVEPGRCAILGALFDHGPVEQRELPETVPTIN